jgi:hypothetical protein
MVTCEFTSRLFYSDTLPLTLSTPRQRQPQPIGQAFHPTTISLSPGRPALSSSLGMSPEIRVRSMTKPDESCDVEGRLWVRWKPDATGVEGCSWLDRILEGAVDGMSSASTVIDQLSGTRKMVQTYDSRAAYTSATYQSGSADVV